MTETPRVLIFHQHWVEASKKSINEMLAKKKEWELGLTFNTQTPNRM